MSAHKSAQCQGGDDPIAQRDGVRAGRGGCDRGERGGCDRGVAGEGGRRGVEQLIRMSRGVG